LVHRVTAYNKAALWDGVEQWFNGGKPVSGEIDSRASAVHKVTGGGGSNWEIWPPKNGDVRKVAIPWSAFVKPIAVDDNTFGYSWTTDVVKRDGVITLPEYYRMESNAPDDERWVVVSEQDVPAETGLASLQFPKRLGSDRTPYTTPDEEESCWKKPGPAAGPFKAQLGDGSVVTYSWYRFADQPALLNADLTEAQREEMQKKVEMLHKAWTKDRQYLPPPTVGRLADLDPALLVTPPSGLEYGYVPIVTRQAIE
jgi:hypothetical protein